MLHAKKYKNIIKFHNTVFLHLNTKKTIIAYNNLYIIYKLFHVIFASKVSTSLS